MTIVSLSDLSTPLTQADVEESMYTALSGLGIDVTSWQPGGVARTIIAATSIVLAATSSLISEVAKGGLLDYAEGDWLTLLAEQVYGVTRIEATYASGDLTLANGAGGVFSIGARDFLAENPTTGKTYTNVSAFVLGAMSTAIVPMVAVEPGGDSTSSAGAITGLVTTLLGVTATNSSAFVGQDEESDGLLRIRCREQLGRLSPMGPWDAYTSAARAAVRSDGTSVGVTRVRPVADAASGVVAVYVATPTGGVTGTADDELTDLGAVDLAIQTDAAPLAVTATAHSASPVVQAVTYELWAYSASGETSAALQERIAAKLEAYASVQPIGGNVIGAGPGKIFVNAIESEIRSVSPGLIFQVTISSPSADIELSVNEVWQLGVVTGVINRVPVPGGVA